MKKKNLILGAGIFAIVLASASFAFAQNFIGPTQNPPNNSGAILVGSSTGALGIATSTIYSTAVGQNILFMPGGNVGVGTTTPTQKFTVQGGLIVAGGAIQAGAGSSFTGTGVNITNLNAANITGGPFAITNYAFPSGLGVGTSTTVGLPANGLFINGSVGIGILAPTSKLTVVGNAEIDGAGNGLIFSDGTKQITAAPSSYWTLSGTSLYPTSTMYNLGIGTTTPQELLSVAGGFLFGQPTGSAVMTGALARTGVIGSSNAVSGNTQDQWIKLAEATLTGTYQDVNADWEIYPNSSYHGSQRQRLEVRLRTDSIPVVSLHSLGITNFEGNNCPVIKTARLVEETTVSPFVWSVWVQMGCSYITGQPMVVRYVGNWTTFALTKVPQQASITDTGTQYSPDLYAAAGDWTVRGNIGIGTTTPAYPLTVQGNIKIVGAGNGIVFSDGTTQTTAPISAANYWALSGVNLAPTSTAYNLGVGTLAPGTKFEVADTQDNLLRLTRSGATYTTTLRLGTDSGLVVNNSNVDTLTLKNGYIGIGTTTPQSALHVYAAASPVSILQDNTAAMRMIPSNGINYIQSGTSLTTNSAADLRFTSINAGTIWMTLQGSSGNLGIGTTTPANLLSLDGAIGKGINFNSNGVLIGSLGTQSINSVSSLDLEGVAARPIHINNSANSNVLLVVGGGNVGIGTTTPTSKLNVVGNIEVDGAGNGIKFADNTFQTTAATTGVNYWALSGSNLSPTSTTYNVGVGIATPGLKMDVAGVSSFPATSGTTQTGTLRVGYNGGNGVLDIGQNSGTGGWLQSTNKTDLSQKYPIFLNPNGGGVSVGSIGIDTNYAVTVDSASTIKYGLKVAASSSQPGAYITNTGTGYGLIVDQGNVGIGKTNPSSALDVVGNIAGSGTLTVTGNTFSLGTANATLGNWVQQFDTAGDRLFMGFSGAQSGSIQFYASGTNTGATTLMYPTYTQFLTPVKITDGTQGNLKVLTSDANGLASWQAPAVAANYWALSGSNLAPTSTAYNVGIGTLTPGAGIKLEVNGKINTTNAGGNTTGDLNAGSAGLYTWNGATRYVRLSTNGLGNDLLSFGAPLIVNYSGGQNVSIGPNGSVPAAQLQVLGNLAVGFADGTAAPANGAAFSGNVGVGTASPGAQLEVLNNTSDNILKLSRSNTSTSTILRVGADGAFVIQNMANDMLKISGTGIAIGSGAAASGVGGNAIGYNSTASGNYSFAAGPNTTASGLYSVAMGYQSTAGGGWDTVAIGYQTTASGNYASALGRAITVTGTNSFGIGLDGTARTLSQSNAMAIMGGNLGVGTTAPGYLLTVGSGGATTAMLGTGATDVVLVGGGAGKITAGSFDPPYTIEGKKYATYAPGMTGQKEEAAGVAELKKEEGKSVAIIDFNHAETASDLWLFSKVTNLKENFDKMTVLLTPAFQGTAWYEKDGKNMKLTIFGSAAGEVSYRLTAPRFDAEKFGNTRPDSDVEGLNLDTFGK